MLFNQKLLNFSEKYHELTHDHHVVIRKDLYLDEGKIYDIDDYLVLNQIIICLKNTPIYLQIQPYLTAKDKVQSILHERGAGLKLAVQLKVEKMRQMLDFEFKTEHNSQEALIGHVFKIDVFGS